MKDLTIKKIEEAVRSIEEDIQEQTGCEYLNTTLESNGFCVLVSFIGIQIWNSDDDDRKDLDVDGEEKEHIEIHLRKKIKEEIKKLILINLQV